jgi:hypothetical protein
VHGDLVMGFESVFCWIFSHHLWDLFQILGNGSFIEEVPAPFANDAQYHHLRRHSYRLLRRLV